ncbi:hypothetical protein RclHR1_04740015 [Rhizophagus clarus]|uniref:Uncharacterized protein n=1 Tax=Rhizophagus clarus TaxID=94130 RepID=A0A2Z6S1S0_9GLOM|nr:hypothetical protein RclHR1_04740015 [Rhizophagus clarus]
MSSDLCRNVLCRIAQICRPKFFLIRQKKVTFEINEKSNSEDEFEEYEETETFDTQDLKEEEITSEEDEAK